MLADIYQGTKHLIYFTIQFVQIAITIIVYIIEIFRDLQLRVKLIR